MGNLPYPLDHRELTHRDVERLMADARRARSAAIATAFIWLIRRAGTAIAGGLPRITKPRRASAARCQRSMARKHS